MLDAFLREEGISEFALLDFSACRVINERLLCRLFGEKRACAVLLFLLPYYVGGLRPNLSRYAVARDYHLYVKELEKRIRARFDGVLAVCADHSPIDERAAAVAAGLGVRGDNSLVLNARYGSYFFIGEIFFSRLPEGLEITAPQQERGCLHCGACRKACPTGALQKCGPCLSALSQQKKLSLQEQRLLQAHGTLWGCDVCQEVCPYNRNLPDTPIAFFAEQLFERVDAPLLNRQLADGSFFERAYAWRGEELLLRNLSLLEKREKNKG